MTVMRFTPNQRPTIGVEIELQLIDAKELSLCSCIDQVLAAIPEDLKESVKPELMQCYVEINTKVCRTVREAGDDLRSKLSQLEAVLHPMGIRLLWAGTHPFSSWRHQKITIHERYHRLVTLMEDVVRRLVTFGLGLLALSFGLNFMVDPGRGLVWLWVWILLGRIGLGFILPSLNLGAMRGVPQGLIPQGSSIISFIRMVGGATGVSLCAIVLEWRLAAGSVQLGQDLSEATLHAFNETFIGLAALTALAMLAAWQLGRPEHPSHPAHKEY